MGNSIDTEAFEESEDLLEALEREGIIKDLAEGVFTILEVATITTLATFNFLSTIEKSDSDEQALEDQEIDLKKSEELNRGD